MNFVRKGYWRKLKLPIFTLTASQGAEYREKLRAGMLTGRPHEPDYRVMMDGIDRMLQKHQVIAFETASQKALIELWKRSRSLNWIVLDSEERVLYPTPDGKPPTKERTHANRHEVPPTLYVRTVIIMECWGL